LVGVQRQYRDPRRTTQWLRWLLIATALIYLISGISNLAQWHVFAAVRDGSIPSEIAMRIVLESIELRYGLLGALRSLVIVGTMTLFVTWTYRTNGNIHALGGQGIQFTPRWAVAWYLVPIANLWMPYQVMSEIWRVSRDPTAPPSEMTSRLLQWWWLCWLALLIAGSIHLRWSIPAHGLEEVFSAEPLSIAFSMLAIISVGLAFVLIKRICALQVLAADRSLSAVFA
jgi:hypothetical protein